MRLLRTPRCASHALILGLQVLSTEAAWNERSWVRKYPCDELPPPGFPSLDSTPFWIDSFRGLWESQEDLAVLKLDILAVYNQRLISCKDINVPLLESSLEFQALGQPVGHLKQFESHCPLPITDALTP